MEVRCLLFRVGSFSRVTWLSFRTDVLLKWWGIREAFFEISLSSVWMLFKLGFGIVRKRSHKAGRISLGRKIQVLEFFKFFHLKSPKHMWLCQIASLPWTLAQPRPLVLENLGNVLKFIRGKVNPWQSQNEQILWPCRKTNLPQSRLFFWLQPEYCAK